MAGDASETSDGVQLAEAARTLEFTPTWALAMVAIVFLLVSLTVERFLLFLEHYLRETKRKALLAALLKMKDELMLMGFISLTITSLQDPVSRLCVPVSIYNKWTPCDVSKRPYRTYDAAAVAPYPSASEYVGSVPPASRRRLLASVQTNTCHAGYEPFISTSTIHQLHIFIVVLALVHVGYSCLTLGLALTRVYRWRKWEREAQEAAAQATILDLIENITHTRQSTFVFYHTWKSWSESRLIVWTVCFFQQFYIPKADYMALRLSFITTHHLKDSYDFHAYMVRSLEDEFETIVGISLWLWGSVIGFWFLNVDGSQLYMWMSLLPIIVVFVIGTKLQHVIYSLARESGSMRGGQFRHSLALSVVLKPRDQLFWFNRPKLLLIVIHLLLFEVAFEFATFIWHVWQFGYNTCLLESNKLYLWGRLGSALAVLFFTSYSTLPLYALVTQMGSSYKKAMLTNHVERVLRQWHKDARQRLKEASASAKAGQGGGSEAVVTPSSASMIVHFKSKITRSMPSRHNSASFRSRDLSPLTTTAEAFQLRPLRREHLMPGSGSTSPAAASHTASPPEARAASAAAAAPPPPPPSASTWAAGTTRSTTIGEVQYLPPHPAFNYSGPPARLQRQSSAPNFEIHPC